MAKNYEFVRNVILKMSGRKVTRVIFSDGSGASEIASDVGIAILLVIVIKSIRGMRHESVGLKTRSTLLDLATIRHAQPASPVQRVLKVDLRCPSERHAPRRPTEERRVPFWRRKCRYWNG